MPAVEAGARTSTGTGPRPIDYESVKKDSVFQAYIGKANEFLDAIGYTEHGQRHAMLTGQIAYQTMAHLGRPERQAELSAIAGYLHDMGNITGRHYHALSGALMAYHRLTELGLPPDEVAEVCAAIGNHEDETGDPVSDIAAAMSIADKADVHRSRVRNPDPAKFDIHDRVNYACVSSFLRTDVSRKAITLELKIDTQISQVMEYFEIFLGRMTACRRAAKRLGCEFELKVNEVRLL